MKNTIAIAALLSCANALTVNQEIESHIAEEEQELEGLLAQVNTEAMEGECTDKKVCPVNWPIAKARAKVCEKVKYWDAR